MISVVIPTRNGGSRFRECLEAIRAQVTSDEVEIIVVDSGSTDGTPAVARNLRARVHEIAALDFGHGSTRNLGAALAQGEIVVFTVDDALPLGSDWLDRLVAPLREEQGPAATYSRQVPREHAPPHQRLYIEYRFGPEPRLQQAAGPSDLTVRTTMFSNVASAVRRDLIERFPFADDIVVGEDGEWCARILLAGHSVAYVPASVVRHSHDYSLAGAFKRYFDLGVSSERTFLADGRSSPDAVRDEGIEFVRRELSDLWHGGERGWIPYTLAHEAARYAGFRFGAHYRIVPRRLRPRLSSTPSYWRARDGQGS